ncbi:MAG: hypothetical protein ACO1RX_08670 [Candidatus Sericytochromatia bacterium]
MSDLVHRSLAPLVDRLHSFTQDMPWAVCPVASEFACLTGHWEQTPVRLESQRFRHPALLHFTWALLSDADTGAYRAVTAYALPRPDLALPLLGLDYVGLGGFLALAALDLAPTDPAVWHRLAAPLLSRLQAHSDACIVRKLPAFAQHIFSEQPLLLAARSEAACEQAVAHALEVLQHYDGWLKAPPPSPSSELPRLEAWCAAMGRNKKEAGALERLFGPGATVYLQDFLFAAPV